MCFFAGSFDQTYYTLTIKILSEFLKCFTAPFKKIILPKICLWCIQWSHVNSGSVNSIHSQSPNKPYLLRNSRQLRHFGCWNYWWQILTAHFTYDGSSFATKLHLNATIASWLWKLSDEDIVKKYHWKLQQQKYYNFSAILQ